jgi:multiple sugar transport system permease protein
VALAIAATTLPYAILLLRPFFLSVPTEVEEAARMDGAGEISCFLRVVLPLARNGLSLITVLLLIGSWGEFLYSVSFLSTSTNYPLSVLLVQQEGFYGTQYNNLMALALIGSLPTIVLFTFVARRLTGGLALGVGK